MFKKNTAVIGFGIGHFIGIADGIAVTTGTPTCKRTLDGTGGACANAAAYNTNGAVWTIDLAAGDMNADVVVLSFTLAGCIPISYTIKTNTKLASDLNDIAATAIVSNGAITTLNGAVVQTNSVSGSVGSVTGLTPATVADAVLDEVVEGALTLRKIMRITLAKLANKASGGSTTTIRYRSLADDKDRIIETVDLDGNRSAVTLDGD